MEERAHRNPGGSPSESGGVRAFFRDAWRGIKLGRELRSTSLKDPDFSLLQALLGGPTKSGARVSEATAFNVSTVGACVNILAQSIAMLPLKVYRKTATGAEEASDHPLHHLLKRKPNAVQTSYQWRGWAQASLCLGGNAYSRIERDRFFQVKAITPIYPCDLELLKRDDGSLVYRHHRLGLLADYELLHLRGLSTNGYSGRSPLHDLRESVGLALTAQEYSARTFSNGNRKPGVVEAAPTKTVSQAQEFAKYWLEQYAGTANAGKTPIMGGGFTWKDAGFSNQDSELLMTRKFEVEEIARAFRVPLTLLQSMEKSTSFGTGIAELSRGFVTYTLTPWLVNWEQELEDKLLTEDEKNAGMFIKFNVGALLRGSPLEQAQKAEVERRCRLVTVNEYRRQQDLDELPDTGANNADWPLNAQESGQRSAPATAPATTGTNDND